MKLVIFAIVREIGAWLAATYPARFGTGLLHALRKRMASCSIIALAVFNHDVRLDCVHSELNFAISVVLLVLQHLK